MAPVAAPTFEHTGGTLPQPHRLEDSTIQIMALLPTHGVATTTAMVPTVQSEWPLIVSVPGTTGVWVGEMTVVPSARDLLDEIKNTSGLTWAQIARVMCVSRRSIHLWLRGNALSAAKEERLHSVLYIVRLLGGRSQLDTRSTLLDKTGGASIVDLLAAGKDGEAEAVARQRAAGNGSPVFFEAQSNRSREILDARRSPTTALDRLETGSGPIDATGGKAKRARRLRRRAADAQ